MSRLIASRLCRPAVLRSMNACEPFITRATSWRHCFSVGSLPAASAGARSITESARDDKTTQAAMTAVRSRWSRDTERLSVRRDLDRTRRARAHPRLPRVTSVEEEWVPARLRESLTVLVAACEDDPAILAAWVGGSLARDTADDWSDIDLHLLVADPETFGRAITDWFGQCAMRPVYADRIPGVAGGFIFVTADWLHVDVIVHGSQDFSQDAYPARVLLDPQGLLRDIPASAEEMVGDPYLPAGQIQLFIYFMGV